MNYSKIAIAWSIWSGLVVLSGTAALVLQYSRTEQLFPSSVDDADRIQVFLQLLLFAFSFLASVSLLFLKEKAVWFFKTTLFGIVSWYFIFEIFLMLFEKNVEPFWVSRVIGGLVIIVAPCVYLIWSLKKLRGQVKPPPI